MAAIDTARFTLLIVAMSNLQRVSGSVNPVLATLLEFIIAIWSVWAIP
jgi:hypothetical protein